MEFRFLQIAGYLLLRHEPLACQVGTRSVEQVTRGRARIAAVTSASNCVTIWRQCTYKRNCTVRSRNHCRRGKGVTSYIFGLCVCCLFCSAIFIDTVSSTAPLPGKKSECTWKMRVPLFSATSVWKHFSSYEELRQILSQMYIGLHVKYPLSFMKTGFSQQIFEKYRNFIYFRLVGAKLFHAGKLTGRHDEANGRFSQFCERT